MEPSRVGDQTLAFQIGRHPDRCCVHQQVCLSDCFFQRVLISQQMEPYITPGTGLQLVNNPQKLRPRMAIEQVNLGSTVECRLDKCRYTCTACAQLYDFFAVQVIKSGCVLCRKQVADAVSGRSGQDAVFVDHGIDRAADLGGRGEPVAERHDFPFERHGQVKSSDTDCLESIDRIRQLFGFTSKAR